ncbi:flagellar biosynthesis protein FlhA [Ruminococcaceae bacterium OttesenSCG-928-A11]|nr:flagellar biosynthesis protein FlhA [Ruminococcaceae bacterium OttesenSCG-928-A11]
MKRFNLAQNIVVILVVAVVLFIIMPLPPAFLDVMFIVNLAISFIVLVITMYIKEPLEFSIFPSVLLITTVLRLSLNVAATRRILFADGDAGAVIRAFGMFVIQENVIIGIVIFLIIVIAQYMVITKGSERVAEVSARFTLDAMPGKQMAIDADLNSGLIDEPEARARREKIQNEADFFGSMDGATKFVKGDSMISIVITFINLIGGAVMGMIAGQGDFQTILDIYGTAAVGNGLLSQIPSLLISVATGMVVTRASNDEALAGAVGKQLTSQPMALIIAGAVISLLVFIGFPVLPCLIAGIGLIVLGVMTMRQRNAVLAPADGPMPDETAPVEEVTSEASYYRNIENVYGLLTVEQIEMEFGYSLLPLVDEASGGSFVDRVVMFRKQFAQEMGMVIPSVRLKDSGQLNPNQYTIRFKGEQVATGDVLIDHYLALSPGDMAEPVDGIDAIEPAFGIPAKWISEDKRAKAELAGYTLVDPTSVIITHLAEVIRQHAHELLNRQEVNNMLANLRKTNETVVEDTIPNIIAVGDLQKVLGNLLREGVPIRDLETIIETLGDYGAAVKDTDMLTEYVRQALRRTISHRFSEAGQLKVITLDAAIENIIMGAVKKMDGGSYLALEPDVIQSIIAAANEQIEKVRELVQTTIVLTSPIVRVYFKKLIDQFYPRVTVLSFNEIDTDIQIQALGNISTAS